VHFLCVEFPSAVSALKIPLKYIEVAETRSLTIDLKLHLVINLNIVFTRDSHNPVNLHYLHVHGQPILFLVFIAAANLRSRDKICQWADLVSESLKPVTLMRVV
jgi:hypothetical protein